MNKNEILELLEKDEETNYRLETEANLITIAYILIDKKIISEEEYKEIKKCSLNKIKEKQIKNMTEEDKKNLEAIKKINDFFRGLGLK